MSRQFWAETIGWATADSSAVANTTTETAVFALLLPGNYNQDGRVLRMRAFGKYSTTGTPTLQFGIRLGGTVATVATAGTLLWQSEAITSGSGAANLNWSIEVLLQTRSNGSTGTIMAMGDLSLNTSTTAQSSQVVSVSGADAPAATAADLTSDAAIGLTAKWGTANAANTLTGVLLTFEAMN